MKPVILLFITLMLSVTSANGDTNTLPSHSSPITLQLHWKHQFEFAGFYAAIEQGYYQQYGLDVKIKEYHSNLNVIDEVITGRAQYGVSDSSLIVSRSNGAEVVLLANIFQHSPMVLLTRGDSQIIQPCSNDRKKHHAFQS